MKTKLAIMAIILFEMSSVSAESIDQSKSCKTLFSLNDIVSEPSSPIKRAFLKQIVDPLLGISELNRKITDIRQNYPHLNFWEAAVLVHGLKLDVNAQMVGKIPKQGTPLVMFGNHPSGFAEGILAGYILEVLAMRSDVKILYNNMLTKIAPELAEKAIELDILSKDAQTRKNHNRTAIAQAIEHLKSGGALVVFPAGSVSSTDTGINTDEAWKTTYLQMALESKAKLMPMYSDANVPSNWFGRHLGLQTVGNSSLRWHSLNWLQKKIDELKPRFKFLRGVNDLRMLAMITNFTRLKNKPIKVRLGAPIDLENYELGSINEVSDALRNSLYEMSGNEKLTTGPKLENAFPIKVKVSTETSLNLQGNSISLPLDAPKNGKFNLALEQKRYQEYVNQLQVPSYQEYIDHFNLLVKEKALVPVVDSGSFEVYFTNSGKSIEGPVLNQLGKARETAFNRVKEGSNNQSGIDLDVFDETAMQFIIVLKETKEILGGYRVTRVDKVIAERGIDGIYSHQYFHYNKDVIQSLPVKILELGRSFTLRSSSHSELNDAIAISLVWKGMGSFLKDHQEYGVLLGPVSISDSYSELSKALIVYYASHKYTTEDIVRLGTPYKLSNPYELDKKLEVLRSTGMFTTEIENILTEALNSKGDKTFEELISSIEEPILQDKLERQEITSIEELKFVLRPPGLVLAYGRMFNGKFLPETWDIDPAFKTVDGLVITRISDIPTKILASYVGGKEIAENMQEEHRSKWANPPDSGMKE